VDPFVLLDHASAPSRTIDPSLHHPHHRPRVSADRQIMLRGKTNSRSYVSLAKSRCRKVSARPLTSKRSECNNLPHLSGWNESCRDIQLQTTPPTRFCSGGTIGRLNYGNSESLSVIVSYPAAITFAFIDFDTEAGFDKITLSSCTSISCSSKTVLLNGHSGSTIPSPVTSTTGIMLIEWQSDGSVTRSGWYAFWASGGES
jgi:hypothetical protein